MKTYTICLEEVEDLWVAHVPALLGCYATAADRLQAIDQAPGAILAYYEWRAAHGDTSIAPPGDGVDVHVDEVVRAWHDPDDPGYEVNAFFAADVPPLTSVEVDDALGLLLWSRGDLGRAVTGLSPDDLAREPRDGWSVERILEHVASAEWWYLGQMGLIPDTTAKPDDWQARLNLAREHLFAMLPELEGVGRVVEHRGELWSPRKMLRRALWHERDHTAQIRAVRAQLGS